MTNFGATRATIDRWFEDMEKFMGCWTINGYESFYGEVIMFCITMAAFLLLIFTTDKRKKLMLSDMLPALIFASLQSIIYPILSFMTIARPCLQNGQDGCISMLYHSLFMCNGFIGGMVLLEVVMLIVFCIFGVSMAFRIISLKVNALNFMAMLFSSMFFNPTIEAFIRAFFPNAKSIEASIIITVLVPFIYFILVCLIILFRRALSIIYSVLKHLFTCATHIEVHYQDIPSEKLNDKDDDALYA